MVNSDQIKPSVQKGILCAKCEHLNRRGTETCRRCGSALYITCKHCKTKNPRVTTKCSNCKHSLHRSRRNRFLRKWMPKRQRKVAGQVALGVAVGFIVYKIIILVLNRMG
ncbi:MAG: hypothetical protein K9N48_03855 [Verrucomicrobia bacterium]|nr:hypothetical protein [Verrucomicrobiota bacterium]MCF7708982.1 hypothetical protein [Verrucomicrobiota bacterium]